MVELNGEFSGEVESFKVSSRPISRSGEINIYKREFLESVFCCRYMF